VSWAGRGLRAGLLGKGRSSGRPDVRAVGPHGGRRADGPTNPEPARSLGKLFLSSVIIPPDGVPGVSRA
jgi:hypothetical protein